jgi:hypothetical protein
MCIEAELLTTNCNDAYQAPHEQKYVHETRILRQLDPNRNALKLTYVHLCFHKNFLEVILPYPLLQGEWD